MTARFRVKGLIKPNPSRGELCILPKEFQAKTYEKGGGGYSEEIDTIKSISNLNGDFKVRYKKVLGCETVPWQEDI
jgi:hypothetical protein